MFVFKNNDVRWLGLTAFFLLMFPIFLNYILQIPAFVTVVGGEKDWLLFWGTYIGSILTAFMVFATFITIRKTININKTQWKIDWLKDYRNRVADLCLAIDITAVNQITQDILFGRFKEATEKGHQIENAVKRNTLLLDMLFNEYDDVFEQKNGEKYRSYLNELLTPFKQSAGEIFQFGFICNYIANKRRENNMDEAK